MHTLFRPKMLIENNKSIILHYVSFVPFVANPSSVKNTP